MTANAVLPVEVQDRLSDLEDLVTGLQALNALLAEVDSIDLKPKELFCLLYPIVELQKQLINTIKDCKE